MENVYLVQYGLPMTTFIIGAIIGYLIRGKKEEGWIKFSDAFALVFASIWIFTVLTGYEISFFFDVVGAMSATHILGEKWGKILIEIIMKRGATK